MINKTEKWETKFMGRLRRIAAAGWAMGLAVAFGPSWVRAAIEYGETLSCPANAHLIVALPVIGICVVAFLSFRLVHSATRGIPAVVREIYQAGYDDAQAVHKGREGGENYRVRDDG